MYKVCIYLGKPLTYEQTVKGELQSRFDKKDANIKYMHSSWVKICPILIFFSTGILYYL